MSNQLQLHLFGSPRILSQGNSVAGFVSDKVRALLFYLAVTGRAHSRTALAELLWAENPSTMRNNLKKALSNLRRMDGIHLIEEGMQLAALDLSTCWLDVAAFTQLADAAETHDFSKLRRAAHLYQGDFLSGFNTSLSYEFESWAQALRAQLRDQMVDVLQRLTDAYAERDNLAQAIATTRHLLQLEPWREEGHRRLIALLAQNDERSAALAHFEICRATLQRELDVEPSAATLDLVADIQAGVVPPGQTTKVTMPPSHRAHRPDPTHIVSTKVEFPLVGREREWQRVRTLWHCVNRPHFLCIGGEAGIGKTRLAEELLRLAEQAGAPVARTRSHALQGQLAFSPVTDWLRSQPLQSAVAGLEDVWLTEIARLLPELRIDRPTLPPPDPLRESWQRKRFFDALLRAFVAVEGDLLLVLDDVQWTDGETLEWLQYLVESDQTRLLVVGTVRTDELDTEHPLHRVRQQLERHDRFTELPLAPLSATATTALATQVAAEHVPERAAEQLFRDTAGNPLFVIESMRANPQTAVAALSPPHPGNHTGQAQRFVPAKIYSVIQARLAQLSPTAQTLVEIGATIGRSFDVALLTTAADLNEETVLTELDELWQRRVIYEVDAMRFDFSHDRIRDVAYSEISPLKRRLLHRRVADALEVLHRDDLDAVCGHLATHCEAAGLAVQAADYHHRAADVAKRLFAHQEAAHRREQAIHLLRELPSSRHTKQKEIDLLVALGDDRTMAYGKGHPSVSEPLVLAHELVKVHGSPVQQVKVLNALTVYDRVRGNWRTALELAAKSVVAAKEANEPLLLMYAQFGIASASMRLGKLETAYLHFKQIVEHASSTSVAQHNLGYWTNFSHCLWLIGFPEQAQQQAVTSVRLVQNDNHPASLPMVLHHSALVYVYCHDTSTVDKLSAELVEVTTNRNDDFALRWGQIYRGWLLVQQGNLHEGIELIRKNADEHRRLGNYFYESFWRSLLAEAYLEASNLEAVHGEIDNALAYSRKSGDCHWNPQLLKLKGDVLWAEGAADTEIECQYQLAIDTAREQQSRSLELRATTSLCRLWQKQGKIAEAHQLLSTIYGWFTEGFDTHDLVEAKALLEELSR